jgi:hypothetical protein
MKSYSTQEIQQINKSNPNSIFAMLENNESALNQNNLVRYKFKGNDLYCIINVHGKKWRDRWRKGYELQGYVHDESWRGKMDMQAIKDRKWTVVI